MTSRDIEAEVIREPFVPLRLHLVSGNTIDITSPGVAWLLQNALLVFQQSEPGKPKADGYDVIAYRNIERIEQRALRRRAG